MYIGKENVHPNVAHLIKQKKSVDEWSRSSRQQNTKKSREGQDWRKRVMCPSFKEKELDDKLMKMLDSQRSVKECMRTTLSEQKMVNSFVSSANHTLQKYFQSDKAASEKEETNYRKEFIDILLLLQKVCEFRSQSLENMTQEQLIKLIKNKLQSMV